MKKTSKLFLLISLITLSLGLQTTQCFAQTIWNQKADCFISGSASMIANFSVGNNGYILMYSNQFWEWNKNSDTWIRRADFPGLRRGGMAGFSIGTKGYVFGGQEYGGFYTDLWEWDQPTDTWTQKSSKGGVGRESPSAFSIGNKGYIVGGYDGFSNTISELWEWDQSTNSWIQRATCPSGKREWGVAFSIGTKAYFGTGAWGSTPTKDFWEWDQSTDTWNQKADFGGGERSFAIGFSLGTKGYIGTGEGQYPTQYQDFWEWDQSTNSWTQKSNVPGSARYEAIGFAINGKGYVGAGRYHDTITGLGQSPKDFWEFDPNYAPPPSPATIAIAAGGDHSLFLCNNNTIMSCGEGSRGQLGDGTFDDKLISIPVSSLNGLTSISGGGNHSLFLKNDGTVWACGANDGRLGDGTNVDKSLPIQVSSLIGITAISAGAYHSLFLKNDATVWACGFNNFLQLGDGTSTDKSTPIQLSSLSGITAISAGYQHSLFLKNDGTVWACGANAAGELGDGTTIAKSTPVQVNSLTGITAITAGVYFSLFLKNDGTVWACGQNASGTLGDGTTTGKSTPVQITSLSGITAISGHNDHSVFLKNDGSVWACGRNNYGELGDGTTVNKSTPVQVGSLSGITAIAAGGLYSLFLKNNGTVWACGYNGYGQLGDGTTVNKSTPVQVIGLCMTCAPPPAPISVNATLCANNTASLSATGTGTLSWYNQAIGGTYLGEGANYTTPILNTTTTYYVQDSTCAPSATRKAVLVTVNPLPTVTANASATNICAGTTVTLTGGGASSYTWSGGVSNGIGFIPTSTTTYTVTGTDGNNCSNTATKTIHVNPLPTVTANASATIVCAGTSITLSGDGATSYTWSGGVTNGLSFVPATTTTYTVTGTDGNNCSNTSTKIINVNPLPIVTAIACATNVCEGTIVTLTGGGADSYTWSDGITNGLPFITSTSTTYTVTGIDGNNCSNTATKTITVTPLLDLTTSLSGLTISANQNGANYQWLNCNNGNSVIAGATNQSYTASLNGNYAVIVKMNSCSDTSTCVNVSITGIEKIAENNIQLKVFPNPGNGSITVTLSGVEGQSINEGIYTIKNESGQMIQTFKLNTSNNYTINIENLSNGIYFIVGLNGNQMINQKVVIAK
jgi:alpha-tubulin suppressor-like RCC1 family protein